MTRRDRQNAREHLDLLVQQLAWARERIAALDVSDWDLRMALDGVERAARAVLSTLEATR